jgi:flavin-dependent dehydrogenase
MQAEISVSGPRLVQWEGLIGLDLGHIRSGYSWVFPKMNHLSVGAGTVMQQAKRLKSGYMAMLDSHGLTDCSAARIRSHWLPVRRKGMAIHSGRCLLLGDAAGLVDPITGEGICNAVRSAQIAAPVIQECLQNNIVNLEEYEAAVGRQIMPELKAARALARVFAWFPGLVFHEVKRSDRLWNAACRMLRGEDTYITLKRRLGPGQIVFDLLTF